AQPFVSVRSPRRALLLPLLSSCGGGVAEVEAGYPSGRGIRLRALGAEILPRRASRDARRSGTSCGGAHKRTGAWLRNGRSPPGFYGRPAPHPLDLPPL